MENAQTTCAFYAIQDVLELLDRANGMIELHRAQKTSDTLAIEGYERQREQLLAQLAELLAQFEVQIVGPPKLLDSQPVLRLKYSNKRIVE